jgi:hypothetical protein
MQNIMIATTELAVGAADVCQVAMQSTGWPPQTDPLVSDYAAALAPPPRATVWTPRASSYTHHQNSRCCRRLTRSLPLPRLPCPGHLPRPGRPSLRLQRHRYGQHTARDPLPPTCCVRTLPRLTCRLPAARRPPPAARRPVSCSLLSTGADNSSFMADF